MKYLIVNGMDESHDLEHEKANSQFQYTFFREIITQTDPNAEVRVLHTYADDINSFSYDDYDVFMWTGGLGNIYLSNQHIIGSYEELNPPEKPNRRTKFVKFKKKTYRY